MEGVCPSRSCADNETVDGEGSAIAASDTFDGHVTQFAANIRQCELYIFVSTVMPLIWLNITWLVC